MSDGTKIEKPKFMRQKRKKIAKWQRIVARRNKGSKRRDNAKQRLQGAYTEATNQPDDYLHKLSDNLVNSGYASFAVEDLHIQNMVKNHRLAGMSKDRDINASINILHRATTLGQRGSHAQGDMASAIQRESKSRTEGLRTDKTHPLRDAVIA